MNALKQIGLALSSAHAAYSTSSFNPSIQRVAYESGSFPFFVISLAKIEQDISFLEECYEHLRSASQLQGISFSSARKLNKKIKGITIGNLAQEWHSDKKANLTMAIDSWLLLALKGMAADSNRSLADEIESALYDYVMNAIDTESNALKEE